MIKFYHYENIDFYTDTCYDMCNKNKGENL